MSKWNTLNAVARDICASLDDPEGKRHIVKVTRLARRAVDQLGLHIFPRVKSEIFVIKDNYTIDLPNHVDDVMKVGLINNDLRVQPFRRYDSIYRRELMDIECVCPAADQDASIRCDACTYHNVWWGNNWYGEYYSSSPVVWQGAYAYNEDLNRIEFGDGLGVTTNREVVVEYKTSSSADDYLIIPSKAFPAIMRRTLEWFYMNSSPGKAGAHHKAFVQEVKDLKRLYDNTTEMDWVNAFRGNYKSSIKW